MPFSACSFRSSLSVRLPPARPPRCEWSGVEVSGSAAAATALPWEEGNTTRLGAVVEAAAAEVDGSTIDSG